MREVPQTPRTAATTENRWQKRKNTMRYEISGGTFPVVTCGLANGEQMITEGGSMVWMTPNMQMETRAGGIGSMFSKAFSGENLFQNIYTARGEGSITFGSSFPGQILAMNIGCGIAFAEIDGDVVTYDLQPGQQLVVDTGNIAGFTSSVQMEIRQVPGLKNKLFGGEGLFNTVLTGPGRIWLQTMPVSGVAAAILPYIPTRSD